MRESPLSQMLFDKADICPNRPTPPIPGFAEGMVPPETLNPRPRLLTSYTRSSKPRHSKL